MWYLPGPLPSEGEALSQYRSSSGEGLEPCLKLLKQAAADKSVKPELVEGALAYLEQNHSRSQQRHGQPECCVDLLSGKQQRCTQARLSSGCLEGHLMHKASRVQPAESLYRLPAYLV